MAFDVSTITGYVEDNKKKLIGKTLLKGKTASVITPQVGVKGSAYLNLLNGEATLQAGGCGWSASGSTAITRRQLVTGLVKVNESFCDKDLIGTFAQYEVQVAVGQKSLPFEEDFLAQKIGSIQSKLEQTIWQGDTTLVADSHLKRFNGFIKLIEAASGVVDATDSTPKDPTDVAEVLDVIDAVYMKLPLEILNAEDAVVFLGADAFRAYTVALRKANLYHYTGEMNGAMEMNIPGTNVKMIGVNGLNGTKKVYAGQLSNFYFGTDMLGDEEKFEFWYSQDNREFRLAVEFNAGVQVAYPTEVVKYLGA